MIPHFSGIVSQQRQRRTVQVVSWRFCIRRRKTAATALLSTRKNNGRARRAGGTVGFAQDNSGVSRPGTWRPDGKTTGACSPHRFPCTVYGRARRAGGTVRFVGFDNLGDDAVDLTRADESPPVPCEEQPGPGGRVAARPVRGTTWPRRTSRRPSRARNNLAPADESPPVPCEEQPDPPC